MSNALKVLCQAVKDRRCTVIRDKKHHLIRVIEPHAIYTNPRGEVVMDCYQTRGHTESGNPPPLWQNIKLGHIRSAFLLGEHFTPRVDEGFDPEKKQYTRGRVAVVDIPPQEPETEVTKPSIAGHARFVISRIGNTIDSILSNQNTLNKAH